MMKVTMHRSARYGLYFVVGAMLLVRRPALSVTYSAEEVLPHSQSTVRLAQQQSDQRVGLFATQDTAWSRWPEALGRGHAVSAGVDACYNASGRKSDTRPSMRAASRSCPDRPAASYQPAEGNLGNYPWRLALDVERAF
jgi:hypothetical protein